MCCHGLVCGGGGDLAVEIKNREETAGGEMRFTHWTVTITVAITTHIHTH